MKKIITTAVMLSLLLITVTLPGCTDGTVDDDRINIVATTFPQYDWLREIIGEENLYRFNLTLLLNTGIDLHSFTPTVQDIATVITTDVFVYVGGHSDSWVEGVLRQSTNPNMIVVNLMDTLGEEYIIRDIHALCEDPDCDDDHIEAEELPADEHVWMSLRRAQILCEALADLLMEIDPGNAEVYRDNMQAYVAQLAALDTQFEAAVEQASGDTIVIADRFPFRYLVDDYGLNHFAAFQGCTAATDVAFSVIISLANRLNQLNASTLLVTESSDQSIARTVINNTTDQSQQILVLNAIQSVTATDIRDGASYLGIMEENLAVLIQALG